MIAPLDTIEVVNVGDETQFNRGSFFFRSDDWSVDEMSEVMTEVVQRSLYYYFAKYGESFFINK